MRLDGMINHQMQLQQDYERIADLRTHFNDQTLEEYETLKRLDIMKK